MNNIEYLNQRISDLEKENNRLKNAIIHLVKDFPNLEESVVQENRESAEVRPLPEVKVLFPNFKRYAKQLAAVLRDEEYSFTGSELDFIEKAQRIVNPSKKQNDWLEAIYKRSFDDEEEEKEPPSVLRKRLVEKDGYAVVFNGSDSPQYSSEHAKQYFNENDPLDF